MTGERLRPDEHNARKWADPPRFEVVDQHVDISAGAHLVLVDAQFGPEPRLGARVVGHEPAALPGDERLVVETDGGRRLSLAHRYGWAGPVPGMSVAFRAGRTELTAHDVVTGERRRVQLLVQRWDRGVDRSSPLPSAEGAD